MLTPNAILMAEARESLTGKWGMGAVVSLIYLILVTIPQFVPFVGHIAPFVVIPPLALGFSIFALAISRYQEADTNQLFEGFQDFARAVVAYLLVTLLAVLGFVLLIVPGVVISIGLSQTFFILADDKSISAVDAVKKSWAMMDGHKWKYFWLSLRFIGWGILCVFTLFIGVLWLLPYMFVSFANFHNDLLENA